MKNEYEIQKEFEQKKQRYQKELRNRTASLRERSKEYDDLCYRKIEHLAKMTMTRMTKNQDESARIQIELDKLTKRESELLEELHLPEHYLELKVDCPDCEDTGYLPNGKQCRCLREFIRKQSLNFDTLTPVDPNGKFENFNLSLYSSKEKGSIGKRRLLYFKQYCDNYSEKPDSEQIKNFFLYGSPGTGKTFVLSCMANYLSEKQLPFIYINASNLMSLVFEDIRDNNEVYRKKFKETPLLLLDDLGSEHQSAYSESLIGEIIDDRLLHNRITVITSNLSPDDLPSAYSQRLFSRLNGNFQMANYTGEDLRQRIASEQKRAGKPSS